MSFNPFHINRWLRGSTLVGNNDQIPDDALRRANNVRLDRTLGQIEARPGWTRLGTGSYSNPIVWISKLYAGAAGIFSYVQTGSTLSRAADTTWVDLLDSAIGTDTLTDVNSPDGNGNFLKYFVAQG